MSEEAGLEVGEVAGDGLRFARAKEALRTGELRLASQAAALTALEMRATNMTAWCTAGLLALGAVTFSPQLVWQLRWSGAAAGSALFAAAVMCLWALLPRDWHTAGYDPRLVIGLGHNTQLEDLETLALGYSDGIIANKRHLRRTGIRLRAGAACVVAAPVIAVSFYLLSS